ncbi:PREDICTED: probable 28S rRNA (cytosine-C(5))-methyltransferase [Rhagoletis zephyria]|uniref:probable 28S rRNA (cytosine-C(5))-methyltransferase n=1 Tax=Rhagoletis zephyria TaxID=28612 RepID=UPI0008113B57|nr:PREDICTED: probable 28S rRNA (cytosine-C(5))-methyltransferase [Rhagoletis zephyria]
MEVNKFNHSVKVPTQYKRTAAVLKSALDRKKSLKSLIFEEKHVRMRGMQAVLKQYIDNRVAIDNAIEQTRLLEDNPRLCPFLCKILVTELIFGRKTLNGESKPVHTVRNYREKLFELLGASVNESRETKVLKPRYVRVNTNLVSLAEVFEMLANEQWRRKEKSDFESYNDFLAAIASLGEDEYIEDIHLDDLLIFHSKQKHYWACHQFVKDKKLMLQDKGTCLVAELLRPPPGSIVLDLCAAPGMKTIHVSNVMKNKGTIYAIEQSSDRYRLLCNMTQSAGCEIVDCIHADALAIDSTQCPGVEYILVDPSCSGSGMQNRMSLDPDEKDPRRLKQLAGLQIKMLSHALSAFPNVKRIAYSTCSLFEEENEQVVQRCLQLNPQFKLLSGKKALRNKWNHVGNASYKKIGKNCLYTRPDQDHADGIFIAIFEKQRIDDDTE